jgi:hypothetical protein
MESLFQVHTEPTVIINEMQNYEHHFIKFNYESLPQTCKSLYPLCITSVISCWARFSVIETSSELCLQEFPQRFIFTLIWHTTWLECSDLLFWKVL